MKGWFSAILYGFVAQARIYVTDKILPIGKTALVLMEYMYCSIFFTISTICKHGWSGFSSIEKKDMSSISLTSMYAALSMLLFHKTYEKNVVLGNSVLSIYPVFNSINTNLNSIKYVQDELNNGFIIEKVGYKSIIKNIHIPLLYLASIILFYIHTRDTRDTTENTDEIEHDILETAVYGLLTAITYSLFNYNCSIHAKKYSPELLNLVFFSLPTPILLSAVAVLDEINDLKYFTNATIPFISFVKSVDNGFKTISLQTINDEAFSVASELGTNCLMFFIEIKNITPIFILGLILNSLSALSIYVKESSQKENLLKEIIEKININYKTNISLKSIKKQLEEEGYNFNKSIKLPHEDLNFLSKISKICNIQIKIQYKDDKLLIITTDPSQKEKEPFMFKNFIKDCNFDDEKQSLLIDTCEIINGSDQNIEMI